MAADNPSYPIPVREVLRALIHNDTHEPRQIQSDAFRALRADATAPTLVAPDTTLDRFRMNRFHSNRRFRIAVLLIASLAAVGAITGFALRPATAPAVATTPAVVADIENTVVATGTLEAAQLVSVGAQVSGRITSLKVQLGEQVKAGALIAEIDSTTQENNVRNARAALASTRAQRSVQVANLKQAELAFERQKTMLAQDATSRADYEAAEATLASTRAQIAALDAQIMQGQTALDTAQANLGYTRITAPMDGTVVALVAKEGQTVNANQAAPTIIKLAKLDTMLVSAEISEADVIKVKPGQKVYFTILGNPEKRYYGTLRTIEPAPASLESETSTTSSSSSSSSTTQAIYYNAQFEVPNPNGELRISMTAQVYVVLAEARSALTIPSAALGGKARDGRYAVKVVNAKGLPEPRTIKVGINNNAMAQVLSGLKAGERVVVGEGSGQAGDARNARRGPPLRMF
jgi:membrane fusion protein, macrolide-specific efflux system